jgi:diaminopimelate epimerase
MRKKHIAKYHALGNDYIVVDPAFLPVPMTEENVRLLCDRHFGVGSDGILYGPLTTEEPFEVRIFNPDGSEAEKSGNGIRIFSKYLADAGYLKSKTAFGVLTKGGLARVTLLSAQADLMEVDMGTASFLSRDIPVTGEEREVVGEEVLLNGSPCRITCLTVGNPHCAIVVDQVSEALARSLGPLVETHPMFPNRINVQIVEIVNRREIKIEIWERGAGYTLASGSSSCAAAAAARRLNLTDSRVTVHMPGGELDIRVEPTGHIFMRGSVSPVFECAPYKPLLQALGLP